MKLTDQDKILAIKRKNEILIGKIYNLYRNEFLNYFKYRYVADSEAIQEIYQDAFMVLCNKIYEDKLNGDNLSSSLKSYLYGVGKNLAYNFNRRIAKLQEDDLYEELATLTEDPGLGPENEKIIQEAVREMGEPCHTILMKQYWENKSGEEIAIEMNYKNADTAKTQKYKCIQKLKSDLRGKLVY